MLAPRASMPALSAAITLSRRRLYCSPESLPAGRRGCTPRSEQSLVGIDVADARDPALVQQERLDRRRPALGQPAQVTHGEALVERLQPEPHREERLERIAAQQQLARAEAARIDDRQPARARGTSRAQLDAHAHMQLLGVRLREHRAGHA